MSHNFIVSTGEMYIKMKKVKEKEHGQSVSRNLDQIKNVYKYKQRNNQLVYVSINSTVALFLTQ